VTEVSKSPSERRAGSIMPELGATLGFVIFSTGVRKATTAASA